MSLSKPETFVLFSLGLCSHEIEKRFVGKPLALSISKAGFVELAQKVGLALKTERAIYRNLETLEKKKYIFYDNKSLALTPRGKKIYFLLHKDILPYLLVSQLLSQHDVFEYTRKVKTVLSSQ